MSAIICGVYKIENKLTGESYIGSSRNIEQRMYYHNCALYRHDNPSELLQNAVNEFGIENFEYCVLKECSEDKLTYYEQKFMDKYHPKYNIYPADRNIPIPVESRKKMSISRTGRHMHSEETRKKMSESIKKSWAIRNNVSGQ